MNPFTMPDEIFISNTPQDMRAGIQRLSSIITTDFGRTPLDGALYVFISRDCQKAKMLRFETNGWCMYYVYLCGSEFCWQHTSGGLELLTIERRQLLWLLEGLDLKQVKAPPPVTAPNVL